MTKTRTLCVACAAALLALAAAGVSAQILIGQTAGMTGSVAASVNEARPASEACGDHKPDR